MKKIDFVLFSGGTGGHVIPAVNFGNYIISKGFNCTLFLDKRGTKYAKNFKGKIIKINSGHLSGNIFFVIKSILLLIFGLFQSIYNLLLIKPKYCVAFGSYASFMPLVATVILKIFRSNHIYIHEQNSVIGKVNLFFIFFSKYVFTNFKTINNIKIKNKNKFFHVGLPIKDKLIIRKRTLKNIPKRKIKILIYGGSQGSVNLNNGFIKIIQKLPIKYRNKLFIIIQSNYKYSSLIQKKLKKLKLKYKIDVFFDNINNIISECDLVISRAGAGTINDIIRYQAPSILVPIPNSIYNHQYFNANFLVKKNAAYLVNEKDLDSLNTYKLFKEILDNMKTRKKIIKNLKLIKIIDANNLMLKKIIK